MGEVLAGVGPRLRAIRKQRQLTLADVAADTGISVPTLSRLESGRRRPTLELLLPLAETYGVAIDELVGAPPTGDPQAHKVVITPGRRTPSQKTHEGYEWMYVLRGRLRS